MLADGLRSRFRAVNDRPYGMMHNLISVITRPLTYFFRYFVILSLWPGPGFPKGSKGLGGVNKRSGYFIFLFLYTEFGKNPFESLIIAVKTLLNRFERLRIPFVFRVFMIMNSPLCLILFIIDQNPPPKKPARLISRAGKSFFIAGRYTR